jgi:mannosidase alpha-like ER degradation enhancer 1
MDYGFPADELRPLSCIGRGSDKLNSYPPGGSEISWCRRNIGINDVCGDFSLTLIDTLDTLAVLLRHENAR